MSANRKTRVAVIFGGRSSEHAVSCVSAGSVLRAIDRSVYEVVPIGISTEGRWVLGVDDPDRLVIRDGKLPEVDSTRPAVVLPGDPTTRALSVFDESQPSGALGDLDVVFPVLHGPYGEDGTIQGLLELADIPYVGSGVLSSAVSMDKAHMKVALAGAGLPVGDYVVVTTRRWATDNAAVRAEIAALGWPVFVKPARAGSSVGITKVKRAEDLDAGMAEARAWDPKVIVEATVIGREIECGVLEGEHSADGVQGAPEASVTAEIRVLGNREFYDFEAKYLDDSTELTVPADISDEVAATVRALSVKAFEALSCESLARVDFFVCADGSVLVNEVNTMPGFTPVSMFPRMWSATGVDYPTLIDRLLRTALQRRSGLR
ncbi:D-alanine--D-alanine ligase family protein [Sporichthya sp.]|uniref:D-alanine--D-alanine ligase family protein n=1 Tax=Sporichthya sp. TaxID=65475 RepID=UPI00180FDDC2|nr:D-alanine--D-alanine ligase family protein [Sporichthya sp.]MBA3744682.1 D-alanine--D-alanine ligase [Sporichthya sp.]